MLLRMLCLVLVLLPLACGCRSSAAPPGPPPPPNPPPNPNPRPAVTGEQAVTASLRTFAFSIFARLHGEQPKANLFVSPLSLSMALHLLANGAGGETRAAILHALAADAVPVETANAELQALRADLQQADPEVKLAVADSVWAQVPLQPAFVQTAQSSYGAAVQTLDFAAPGSADRINAWAKEQTAGLIPSVIDDATLQRLTMVLLDAVYFKGRWESVFSKRQTKQLPFHLLDGGERQVPMMAQSGEFSYGKDKLGQVIRLPYGQGRLAMYVLLPDAGLGLGGLVSALSPAAWEGLTEKMQHGEGTIKLPRFTARYEAVLNTALSALGMGVAFDRERADFGALSQTRQWVDLVKHTSFLKVDEEGTEAAAVTEIGVAGAAPPAPTEPFEMVVDRPFVLLIEDAASRSILFMGAIVAPEQAR